MEEHSYQNPDINVNIAVSGYVKNVSDRQSIKLQIENIINDVLIAAREAKCNENGGFEGEVKITFFVTPYLIDSEFISVFKELNINSVFKCIAFDLDSPSEDIHNVIDICDGVTELKFNKSIDSLSGDLYAFTWISDQVDFSIILIENNRSASIQWKFADHMKKCGVSSVLIDVNNPSYIFWTEKSYFDTYREDNIRNYINNILTTSSGLKINSNENKSVFGYKLLWGNLYNKYMKKYKAKVDTSKPYIKDNIFDDKNDFISVFQNEDGIQARKDILNWFLKYDGIANQYGEKYRSTIYLRAIIPLITTIFLAIGFYIETLLSPMPVKITILSTAVNLWSVIAGVSFFIHALLYLYIYKISENKIINSWHKSYIDNRFVSEALRIAIHLIPFGMPLKYDGIIDRITAKVNQSKASITEIRALIRSINIPSTILNEANAKNCLNYLKGLISDQIEYHKNSIMRYEKIISNLKMLWNTILLAGIIFIVFRGTMQLYFGIANPKLYINALDIQSYSKSFTNMLALLIPAWAGYFFNKLSLCNFEGLYNNHKLMIKKLTLINNEIEDGNRMMDYSYNRIFDLSRDIYSVMLGDVNEWYSQINTRKVTKL